MLEFSQTDLEFEEKNHPTINKNEIEKQLEKMKEKKERIKDLYIDGDLTKDQYKKRLEKFQEEEKELLTLLNKVDEDASIEEIKEILQNIKNEWHNMSYESKKHAIQSIFQSLTIEIVDKGKQGAHPKPATVKIKDYQFR